MKYRDMNVPATQREKADPRQVENSAGGYVYEVSPAQRLRRFLVLGTEGGTFYASQKDLTKANLDFLKQYATDEPGAYYAALTEIDRDNIAPRHSTVLLALAVLFAHAGTSKEKGAEFDGTVVYNHIKENFTSFVRTGTHLFEFVDYVTMFRAWGRGLRRLISSWYTSKTPTDLAYQIVKYRQRGGWTHRDLLRKTHPKEDWSARASVLDYVAHGLADSEQILNIPVIDQFEAVKAGTLTPVRADALPWEALPTEALTDPLTWLALLTQDRLPFTAMLRNLGRMTSIGVFNDPFALGIVVGRLTDAEQVKKARLHPFNALTALKTYSQGYGFRGSLTWTPKQPIVDALDRAFSLAFGNVEPTGKRINIALDVSGSMGAHLMDSNVTAREGAMAMSMATLAADPETTDVTAFTSGPGSWTLSGMRQRFANYPSGISEVGVSPRRRLDDNVRSVASLRMGGTDCALPMLWAYEGKRVYDAFVIYTDNETWAGSVQPMDALRAYRKDINPEARLIVVGMTSTGFTIADPADAGSLDVVGFDASAPSLISNFIAGKF